MAEPWQQWLPFHIDRWRGSPDVRAMHPAARMGYLELLCSCWQSSDCTISDDPLDLATASGLGDELWALYGARILRKFVSDRQGKLQNPVLLVEWNTAREKFTTNRQARSEAGKMGAAKRWHSSATESDSKCHEEPRQNMATGTETVTGTETKEKNKAPSAFELPLWIDAQLWAQYEEMRRKVRKPMTDKARELAVATLVKLETQGHRAEDVLNQSIMHSWQGLFAVKSTNGGTNGRTSQHEQSIAVKQAVLDARQARRLADDEDRSRGGTKAGPAGADTGSERPTLDLVLRTG